MTKPISITLSAPLPEPLPLGAGWNWFDHLGSGGHYARYPEYPLVEEVVPDLDDEAGWKAIRQALHELRPGVIRFGLPPNPHCGPDGTFQEGSVHLERLRRLDAWAQETDCTLVLDTFLIPAAHETDPARKRPHMPLVSMAPADNAAYARQFVAPLLKWCVEAGLESVRWFNPVNEALHGGIFQVPDAGNDPATADMKAYVDMYREMRRACDEMGVPRERIGLLAFDGYDFDSMGLLRMHALGLDIDPWIDGYSIHYYNHRLDSEGPSDHWRTHPISLTMGERVRFLTEYCRLRGKRLFAMEIGSFHYGWRYGDPAGPARHECCLTVAEAVIRGAAAGLAGFAFWSFLNPNTVDGWFRVCRVENGTLYRSDSPWHVYGLLSRNLRPGSTVLPVGVTGDSALTPHLHGVAVETPDAGKAILLVNDHRLNPIQVRLALPPDWAKATWRHTATDTVRRTDLMPVPAPSPDGHGLDITLPPLSLNALNTQS